MRPNYRGNANAKNANARNDKPRSGKPWNDKPRNGSGQELLSLLENIDHSSYGAYKRATGTWKFDWYTVHIDRVQSDPYAPPSAVRVTVPAEKSQLPAQAFASSDAKTATADFLVRNLGKCFAGARPGALSIARTGQEILERSAGNVSDTQVELRIQVRLPARGRTVLGKEAATIFRSQLPAALDQLFDFADASYQGRLTKQIQVYEDYLALRGQLELNNWVTFVADGALLARESGISQLPMQSSVPFSAPETRRVAVKLPHAGKVEGMAIPAGITLIVGGGYHGKSTLLSAIQRGVYAHVPGDGRELVATLPQAVKLRAADGRPVTKVDVSSFINHLPSGASTTAFSTQNASGSTSQAASLIEAVQAGAPLLLLDEDTSATNLLIRDARMRALVSAGQEPITPLVDRIRSLYEKHGISVMMVMGGSGDYLDPADLVLQMDSYHCLDVTNKAKQVAGQMPRVRTDLPDFPALSARVVVPTKTGGDRPKTKADGLDRICLDRDEINVFDVEQIVESGQTEAIAWAVRAVTGKLADGQKTLEELTGQVEALLQANGLDCLTKFGARTHPAFLVRPRSVDIAAAVNRYRKLQIR